MTLLRIALLVGEVSIAGACHHTVSEGQRPPDEGVEPMPEPGSPTRTPSPALAPNDTDLDVLTEYDRSLWPGPDQWSPEQWMWKRRLRWDRDCDYFGHVTIDELSDSLSLVRVECVPGAFEPLSYVYIYDSDAETGIALEFPTTSRARDSAEKPFALWGSTTFDSQTRRFAVIHLSRGTGDCGSYEVYAFDLEHRELELELMRERECSEIPLPDPAPPELFEPTHWPIVFPKSENSGSLSSNKRL